MAPGGEAVQVVVRCRPLFGKELAEGRQRIVDMDTKTGQVTIKNPKAPEEEKKKFTFDKVFDWNCTQREVYDGAGAPIVNAAIEGKGESSTAHPARMYTTRRLHATRHCFDPPPLSTPTSDRV